VSGTTLTFSTAPPTGTSNIEVVYGTPLAIGTPSDGTVTTSKLVDANVTYAKIQNVTAGKVLGRDTSGSGVVQELPIAVDASGNTSFVGTNIRIRVNDGTNFINVGQWDGSTNRIESSGRAMLITSYAGGISFGNSGGTDMQLDTSANLKFNSGYGSAATAYGCRAWVNFNGVGTVSIRASGNVSSITDNGVGNYRVNFTTSMPDTSYSISSGYNTSVSNSSTHDHYNWATSGFDYYHWENNVAADAQWLSGHIFR
jgi:hypothetical protein